MSQFIIDTIVKNGHIEINNLPYPDLSRVKILVFPEADLKKMSFKKAQALTGNIKGKLSDEIDFERGER
jgi:hypothetical protein